MQTLFTISLIVCAVLWIYLGGVFPGTIYPLIPFVAGLALLALAALRGATQQCIRDNEDRTLWENKISPEILALYPTMTARRETASHQDGICHIQTILTYTNRIRQDIFQSLNLLRAQVWLEFSFYEFSQFRRHATLQHHTVRIKLGSTQPYRQNRKMPRISTSLKDGSLSLYLPAFMDIVGDIGVVNPQPDSAQQTTYLLSAVAICWRGFRTNLVLPRVTAESMIAAAPEDESGAA